MVHCAQCQQSVCQVCCKEDKCCLVRPWGEKEKERLKSFCENKLVNSVGMRILAKQIEHGSKNGSKWNSFRKNIVRKSLVYFIELGDVSFVEEFGGCCSVIGECFPDPSTFEEEKMVKFLEDAVSLCRWFVPSILARADIVSMMSEHAWYREGDLRARNEIVKAAILCKEVFLNVKTKGIMDAQAFKAFKSMRICIGHLEAYIWAQDMGLDVLSDPEQFQEFVKESPVEVMEYLMVQKGMSVGYMAGNRVIRSAELLEMIHKLKGLEEIQRISLWSMEFSFDVVRCLRQISYVFDRTAMLESCFPGHVLYALVV